MVESPKNSRLVGVVYRRNLLEVSSTRIPHPVTAVYEEPALIATVEDSLWETVKKMLRIDEWYAPVVEDSQSRIYRGVLGLEHVIERIVEEDPEPLEETLVESAMTKEVISIKASEPVRRAWQIMLSEKLAALPVVDEKNRLIGVVAEYDLLRYGYARPRLESDNWISRGPSVKIVMSSPPVTVMPSDSLLKAAEYIVDRNIGRVYVVNGENHLVGVVDREDIVRAYMGFRRIA